jgi:chitin synthase
MDPRRPLGRTPSPGQPLRNYQLEDRYASPGPLEIPMGPNPAAASGDRLPLQPSVRMRAQELGPQRASQRAFM